MMIPNLSRVSFLRVTGRYVRSGRLHIAQVTRTKLYGQLSLSTLSACRAPS
jgi:hypothetical protein